MERLALGLLPRARLAADATVFALAAWDYLSRLAIPSKDCTMQTRAFLCPLP